MLTEKKKKKKKIYMHKPFFLDLADMYNYIKMVLAHLMVVFHFNRIRRATERGDAVCRRDFSVAAGRGRTRRVRLLLQGRDKGGFASGSPRRRKQKEGRILFF